jgi:hypothetical protein
MMDAGEDIELGGWRVEPGFAVCGDSAGLRHFYAVYTGDAFGHPERGVIAIMARAHPDRAGHEGGAYEAAQLVVHGFAEGYFGAPKTLGPKRAASHALHSINSWLVAQIRADSVRHFAPVSITALLFCGAHVGIIHIGACRLYRERRGEITPLLRHPPERRRVPARAIGLDQDLSIDYQEEVAEQGDRLLVVSGMESAPSESLKSAFALQSLPGVALMRLDILAAPAPDAETVNAELSKLPLRPAPREGDVWDGFVIGKTLYHGRYTVLKAAHDSIENREVALKIALPTMLQDQVFAAGFMREAWIGSSVRGTHIARYIELPPERRSSLYLVLPLYRGETLETRLNRAPAISLPDGIGIALQLCEAVQDLAAIQIVHRDIKPDNIMLLEGNQVKLLDLGLAYLPGIDVQDAVKPGGTLRYMAPELLQGVQANARTEVYAIAVTIYRMFSAGAYPFGQREAIPLARFRPDLPSWLGRILQRALLQDSQERFADAGEMALALNQGLISGAQDAAKPGHGLTKLQLWQIAAGAFAIGFFVLLIRALR